MPKLRRGGYTFIARCSDRPPRHVHVYRNGHFVVKWDLQNRKSMKGKASPAAVAIIEELEEEGRL